MSRGPAVFSWPISSYHGWGLRGLGMALNYPGGALSADGGEAAVELPPDDPRAALLRDRIERSRSLADQIARSPGPVVELGVPVFVALGNDLTEQPVAGGRFIRGRPTIACPVFEDEAQVEANIERLRPYDAVVVASAWNREVLAGLGVEAVLVHEGIDPVIFHTGVKVPRQERGDRRFRVLSGGKPEWRKGQELVLEAFARFADSRRDAVLVAAWQSPFSGAFDGSFARHGGLGAPPGSHIGMPNYHAWAQRAGVRPEQFELLPMMPNWQMSAVYGSCDVALFPNRREGGTNFVAMEAEACGVRTIIRQVYGMADLFGREYWQLSGDDRECVEGGAAALADAYDGVCDAFEFFVGTSGTYWTWERHCRELARLAERLS